MNAGRFTGLAAMATLAALSAAAGCQAPATQATDPGGVRQRAMDCLKRGVRYEYLPSVRTAAIEALAVHATAESLPWIRQGLSDESPAVRFAAAMALGSRRDEVALPALRKLYEEGTPTDRIGAIYALHQMGDTGHTAELARYLLEGASISERGNAALVLGRLGGEGTNSLLAAAMHDSDPAMRVNVLEAMALQRNEYAIETLHANAYGGIGAEEVFALNTLAALRDPKFADLFRLRLESALHVESKLAAARGLALLGDKRGYALALESLNFKATQADKQESTENRTQRVHQMAAHALGAIGDARAVPALSRMMNTATDPRTQIAAANAILSILDGNSSGDRPPGTRGPQRLAAQSAKGGQP